MNKPIHGRKVWQYPYEVRVAACADYLIGLPQKDIEDKYGVSLSVVVQWIRARKCFKTRGTRSKYMALGRKQPRITDRELRAIKKAGEDRGQVQLEQRSHAVGIQSG